MSFPFFLFICPQKIRGANSGKQGVTPGPPATRQMPVAVHVRHVRVASVAPSVAPRRSQSVGGKVRTNAVDISRQLRYASENEEKENPGNCLFVSLKVACWNPLMDSRKNFLMFSICGLIGGLQCRHEAKYNVFTRA